MNQRCEAVMDTHKNGPGNYLEMSIQHWFSFCRRKHQDCGCDVYNVLMAESHAALISSHLKYDFRLSA